MRNDLQRLMWVYARKPFIILEPEGDDVEEIAVVAQMVRDAEHDPDPGEDEADRKEEPCTRA